MELRHLRYFLAVAEELHFGRAARRLNIVQPALSMQVRALEQELGAELFFRDRRKVELSAAGRALLPEARRILAQAATAADMVRRTAAGVMGAVRVGYAASALYSGVLGRAVQALRASHPDIELQVDELHPHSQYEQLREGRVDVTLGPAVSLPPDPALRCLPLVSLPLQLALPAGHRLAALPGAVAPQALRDEPFVGYSGEHDEEGAYLTRRALGYRPEIRFHARSPVIALGLVEAGLGLAIVSSVLAERFPGGVSYRPLAGVELQLDVSAVSRREERDPAVRVFCAILERLAAA